MKDKKLTVLLLALAVPVLLEDEQKTLPQEKRPFRVQDSVEMIRILDPERPSIAGVGLEFAVDNAGTTSPDGRFTAVLLTHGDVSNNTNIYQLVVYENVTLFTDPRWREVARMVTTSSRPGIARVKWLADSRRIAFLGERPHELPQIWILDTNTDTLAQLTHHTTLITDYDITSDGSAWVYAADLPRGIDSPEYFEKGFVFRWPEQSLLDVIAGRYGPSMPEYYSQVYIKRAASLLTVRVKQESQRVRLLSIGPNGDRVVELLQVQSSPAHWGRYENEIAKGMISAIRDKRNRDPYTNIYQYFVINGDSGDAYPLLDAPELTSQPILWTKDGREVIVCQTFLPLSWPKAAKTGYNNVMSVSLDDKKTDIIRSESDSQWLRSAAWDRESNTLILKRGNLKEYSVHTRVHDKWQVTEGSLGKRIGIAVKQGINDVPELEAREWIGDRVVNQAVVSHLNPST